MMRLFSDNKGLRKLHITTAMRFGRSIALTQIALRFASGNFA